MSDLVIMHKSMFMLLPSPPCIKPRDCLENDNKVWYLNDIPWNGGSLPMSFPTLIPHECAYLEMKFSFS